jgi:3-oxoacyl-[acyl-carrier-protein] synthase III
MAVAAARTALDRAGQESTKLDSIIHSSVLQPGPDGWSLPGYTLLQLGGGHASVTELRMGCSAMLTAMELAVGQMTGAQRASSVLLTAADNFGPWIDRWKGDLFLASDAGSAALLSTVSGFARVRSLNSRTIPELEGMQRGDQPIFSPEPAQRPFDLKWRRDVFLGHVMSGLEVAFLMADAHVQVTRQTIAEAGLEIGDITKVLYHNMSHVMVKQFVLDPLGLDMERSGWEYGRTVGHMGASDQLVALEHLLLSGELKPGDHVLLCGAAAGFASASVLLEILEVPSWTRPLHGGAA